MDNLEIYFKKRGSHGNFQFLFFLYETACSDIYDQERYETGGNLCLYSAIESSPNVLTLLSITISECFLH